MNALTAALRPAGLTADYGILRHADPTTIEDLGSHVATIEQATIQANCETRILAGKQVQAFTAAVLPLCRQV